MGPEGRCSRPDGSPDTIAMLLLHADRAPVGAWRMVTAVRAKCTMQRPSDDASVCLTSGSQSEVATTRGVAGYELLCSKYGGAAVVVERDEHAVAYRPPR
jgi:hypothetical protein